MTHFNGHNKRPLVTRTSHETSCNHRNNQCQKKTYRDDQCNFLQITGTTRVILSNKNAHVFHITYVKLKNKINIFHPNYIIILENNYMYFVFHRN